MTDARIITALDFSNADDALALAEKLDPALTRIKVGKELFTRAGPTVVADLHAMKFDVFLDLKFHDIPNTVAGAVRAAAEMGVWMMNVHACGGERMLQAARQAVDETGHKSLLIAVTVLTSLTDDDMPALGVPHRVAEQVIRFAELTATSGLDGVVCSSQEVAGIKQAVAASCPNFLTVTPGIRPATHQSQDDQRRTLTPTKAIANGSDFLVIGRPITQAPNPNDALSAANDEVRAALSSH